MSVFRDNLAWIEGAHGAKSRWGLANTEQLKKKREWFRWNEGAKILMKRNLLTGF
jgi:hypothetical protein